VQIGEWIPLNVESMAASDVESYGDQLSIAFNAVVFSEDRVRPSPSPYIVPRSPSSDRTLKYCAGGADPLGPPTHFPVAHFCFVTPETPSHRPSAPQLKHELEDNSCELFLRLLQPGSTLAGAPRRLCPRSVTQKPPPLVSATLTGLSRATQRCTAPR
jgi:hypothetical protein